VHQGRGSRKKYALGNSDFTADNAHHIKRRKEKNAGLKKNTYVVSAPPCGNVHTIAIKESQEGLTHAATRKKNSSPRGGSAGPRSKRKKKKSGGSRKRGRTII